MWLKIRSGASDTVDSTVAQEHWCIQRRSGQRIRMLDDSSMR